MRKQVRRPCSLSNTTGHFHTEAKNEAGWTVMSPERQLSGRWGCANDSILSIEVSLGRVGGHRAHTERCCDTVGHFFFL